MIRVNEFEGFEAEIGDDYILLDFIELRGIADIASMVISDDSSGDEILNARLIGVRSKRNTLLRESDCTQVADFPVTDEQRLLWRAYRQALRDLPSMVTKENIFSVVWPVPPA